MTYKIPETNIESEPYQKLPDGETPFFNNNGIKPTETKHQSLNGAAVWTAYYNLGSPAFQSSSQRQQCRAEIDLYGRSVADIENIILKYVTQEPDVPKK